MHSQIKTKIAAPKSQKHHNPARFAGAPGEAFTRFLYDGSAEIRAD